MSTPDKVEFLEVIFVSASRGDGTPGHPRRSVLQYWSKGGVLLAELDGLFEYPDHASHYAVERLMQLRGIAWEATVAGESTQVPHDCGAPPCPPRAAIAYANPAPHHPKDPVMTQQEIIDQLEALKPKYEAMCVAATAGLDAERKSLQAACGQIGHIWKRHSLGFSRDRGCAVCGVWESKIETDTQQSPSGEEGVHA